MTKEFVGHLYSNSVTYADHRLKNANPSDQHGIVGKLNFPPIAEKT